jgi:hypothetical protein
VTARPGGRPALRQSADEDTLSSREPKPPALPSPLAATAGQRRELNTTREATTTQILLEGLDWRTPDDGGRWRALEPARGADLRTPQAP